MVGEVAGSGQSALAVKQEPTDPLTADSDPVATEGEVNTLIPKKKSRKKREASADEDMPVPPPPMKTIRLTLVLTTGDRGMGSEFNVVEEARKLGLEPTWQPLEEPLEGQEEEVKESAVPAGGILSQLNDDGMTAEEIAKRYEDLYDKPSKKTAKKKKVSETTTQRRRLIVRSRTTMTSQMISSMIQRLLSTTKRPISPVLRKKASSFTSVLSS